MQKGDSLPGTPLASPRQSHFDSSPSAHSSTSTALTTPSRDNVADKEDPTIDTWDEMLVESSKARPGFVHLDGDFGKQAGLQGVARNFDWSYSQDAADPSRKTFERRLGPTEASYYLGSRGAGPTGGVNDMYLHIGFRAPSDLVTEARILDVWKTILSRHTLLWSSVEFRDYYDIHFVNRPPLDGAEFEQIARSRMALRTNASSKTILDDYLNGDRFLSDERLAFLMISTPEDSFSAHADAEQEFDFYLYSTHFLGDGMALHSTANEFFSLLASDSLRGNNARDFPTPSELASLPPALENVIKLSSSWGRTAWSAAKVDFQRTESKNLGGQAFPRASLGPRRTVVPTVSYSPSDSRTILSTCKSNRSTIASALFALSNLAYVRSTRPDRLDKTLPTNLYSALNVRGFLDQGDQTGARARDPYHLAIGYYNIILPSFFPTLAERGGVNVTESFWNQARSVRLETSKVVQSRFLPSRTLLMAFERERRSIGFERAAAAAATGRDETTTTTTKEGSKEHDDGSVKLRDLTREDKKQTEGESKRETTNPLNVSLMGLSMLGNLDGIYNHSEYVKSGIELHTLTTGSRQRPGALLLFSYTFAGKLWISLGYDSNGFERRVIEEWWNELLRGVDEMLLLPIQGQGQ